jgi:hypothetical protein
MKKFSLYTVTLVLISVFVFSCAPEEDGNDNAPIDQKQKWIGNWTCQETAGMNPATYTIHIIDSVGTNYVLIENLYSSGFSTRAKGLINATNLTIANQPLGSGGYSVDGNGNMANNTTVNMNFNVNDGSSVDNVVATLTKQ